MTVRPVDLIGLLLLGSLACGAGEQEGPAEEPDAPAIGRALVRGVIDGRPVDLRHAALIRGPRLQTLCVSDEPIETVDCGYFEENERTLLFARFGADGDALRWAFPQVEIRQNRPQRWVRLSMNGTIDSPAGGRAEGYVLELRFDDHGVISGTVTFPRSVSR